MFQERELKKLNSFGSDDNNATDAQDKTHDGNKVQWHPAFFAAINLELRDNRDDFEFQPELAVSRLPLKADVVIIKKKKPAGGNVVPPSAVVSSIGKFFLGHNVIEYKSPDDQLDLNAFYKAQGYACLYKSSDAGNDSVRADDVTVTLVRAVKPRALFQELEELGFIMTEAEPGIYLASGAVCFPVQIVVTDELGAGQHAWLNVLTNKVDAGGVEDMIAAAASVPDDEGRQFALTVLDAVLRANPEVSEAMKRRSSSMESLVEMYKQSKEEGITIGEARGIVKSFLKFNASKDQIILTLQENLNITREEALQYYEQFGKG